MVNAVCFGVRARGGSKDYRLGPSGSEKAISMHNREIQSQKLVLCTQTRIGGGSLVRDVIAEKQSWSFSFKALPYRDEMTVDGGMGCNSLRDMVTASLINALVLKVPTEDGLELTYNVMIDPESFAETVVSRRGTNWKYDVKFVVTEI